MDWVESLSRKIAPQLSQVLLLCQIVNLTLSREKVIKNQGFLLYLMPQTHLVRSAGMSLYTTDNIWININSTMDSYILMEKPLWL